LHPVAPTTSVRPSSDLTMFFMAELSLKVALGFNG
jgi:hypothetical protein